MAQRSLWVALLIALVVISLALMPAVDAKKKGDDDKAAAAAKKKLADKLAEAAADDDSGKAAGGKSADKAKDNKSADKSKDSAEEARKRAKRRAKQTKRWKKRRARVAERIAKSLARARRANKTLAAARADRKKRTEQLAQRKYKRAAKLAEKLRSAAQKSNRAKANDKLRWMQRATAGSNTNVLSFNTDQYKEYAMSGPRPYFLFVSLTALHSGYRCHYCQQLHDQFVTLAPAYNAQHNAKLPGTIELGAAGGLAPSLCGAEGEVDTDDNSGDLPGVGTSRPTAGVQVSTADGVTPANNTREAFQFNGWWWVNAAEEGNAAKRESFKSYPVFFVEVDIARNQDLFNALNLKTAPVSFILPPKLTPSFTQGTAGLSNSKLVGWFNGIDKKYHFQQASASISIDEVHTHVSKWTTVRADLTPPIAWGNLVWLVLAGAGGCAFLWYAWVPLSKLRGLPLVLCLVGLGFYTFCIGGGMYNYIREIPFSETQKDGSVSYIYYSARDQLGAEGYIMGFLQSACGICTVLAIRNARSTSAASGSAAAAAIKRSKGSAAAGGAGAGVAGASGLVAPSALRGTPLSFLFDLPVATYIGALVICWYSLIHIYTLKNGGYRHGWLFESFSDWM